MTTDHRQVILGEAFDTRPNAFNALRLMLACTVVVWHAILYTGGGAGAVPWQVLGQWPVDGFFLLSGFLITRSWDRRRDPVAFLRARAARLLPGLWVCLIVTAFVIVPLVGDRFGLLDQLRYVVGNSGIRVTQLAVGDSLPVPHGWNVSLWTLWYEALCYLAVLGLGTGGALRPPVVAGFVAMFWAWMVIPTWMGTWLLLPNVWQVAVPRLGLMFALGALAYLVRGRIPMSPGWAGISAAALAFSALTPNYHLLGAPAMAYLVLWVGIETGRFRRLRLETDVSYGVYVYGAPVLFALLLGGVASSWWAAAAWCLAIVLPLAALSWFLVERPVLELVRGPRPARDPAAVG